jgi:hypothetical protein
MEFAPQSVDGVVSSLTACEDLNALHEKPPAAAGRAERAQAAR